MWTRRLGPRVRFGVFSFLSPHQTFVAALGYLVALTVLMRASEKPWALPVTITIGGFVTAAVAAMYKGMPIANWSLKAFAYVTGSKGWQARPVGEDAEQLPRELADVKIVPVRDGSALVGMLQDARTLSAVAKLEVDSLGLFDESEQARRMDAFARVLDDFARESDERYRVSLIKKHVPRRANLELAYVQEHARDLESPQAQSMLTVVRDTQSASHEDELYVCVRYSRQDPVATASRLMDRLTSFISRVEAAEIAVKTPGRLLEPRELAKLVKDSFDPFGRPQRDQLERATGLPGTDPAAAWPDGTYRHVDCYEADGAFHVTYWMRGWPPEDVGPGWMRPLTLRCDVPALTIVTVLKPEHPARARKQIQRQLTRAKAATIFRADAGQDEAADAGPRQEFLVRQKDRIAKGSSTWRWETYVTVSVPEYADLAAAAERVESACVDCHLTPVALRFAQAEAFTFALPLGRGLEPESARL